MKIIKKFAMTFMVCAMVGTVALAKTRSHRVEFDQDTMVNGTLLKKGAYQAKFDEQANELRIFKNGHDIVDAAVKEEPLEKKASLTSLETRTEGNGAMLTKVTFGGDRYSLLLGDS